MEIDGNIAVSSSAMWGGVGGRLVRWEKGKERVGGREKWRRGWEDVE